MEQIAMTFDLARRTDPITSANAAEKAQGFRKKHEATIYGAIVDAGPHGATYREIAALTGMEPVAVARRLKGMESRQIITRYLDSSGVPAEVRDGCAVWFMGVK